MSSYAAVVVGRKPGELLLLEVSSLAAGMELREEAARRSGSFRLRPAGRPA